MERTRPVHRGVPRPQTSEFLRHLLLHEERYRKKWLRYVRRSGRGGLHQAAIAWVLAHYLWDTGERDESHSSLPRSLRDTVNRALNNGAISTHTMHNFLGAFGMSEAHAAQLWSRYVEDGKGIPGVGAAGERRTPVPSSAYRTLTLDERHFIGPEGLPHHHETSQVIQAINPMERFSFQFDTALASVQVTHGGQATHAYPAGHERPEIHAVDIMLPRKLRPGDTKVLSYRSIFRYQEPPPPEFRRMFRRRVRSAVLQVHFHAERVPSKVWHARWATLDAGPELLSEVELAGDHSAHAYLEDPENLIAGFCWSWDG